MSYKYKIHTPDVYIEALKNIRDNAFSPIDDDWIWMDDQTPLGQYIDQIIQECDFSTEDQS